MSSKPLTPRQQQILAFIWSRVRNKQAPPSLREIGAHFGISSPNGVACHLKALERKGCLQHDANRGRTLRLTPAARKRLSGIPLIELSDLAK